MPSLPKSDKSCVKNQTWKGIVAGISSRNDVEKLSGIPRQAGDKREMMWLKHTLLEYPVDAGLIAKYVNDHVYLDSSNTVEAYAVYEVDRSGLLHQLSEVSLEVGTSPAVIYANGFVSSIEALHGPDLVTVWPECGLAVRTVKAAILVPQSYPNRSKLFSSHAISQSLTASTYAKPVQGIEINVGSIQTDDQVILMRLFFRPTTLEAFQKYYMGLIPYSDFATDVYKLEEGK